MISEIFNKMLVLFSTLFDIMGPLQNAPVPDYGDWFSITKIENISFFIAV